MYGHPLCPRVQELNSLAAATEEAANSTNQPASNTQMDQLGHQDGMVNVIKCFAKVQKAHTEELARAVKGRQPIVQHVQQAVGCRSTFKAAKLLRINMMFNVNYQPLNKEIFKHLREHCSQGNRSQVPVTRNWFDLWDGCQVSTILETRQMTLSD